MKMRMIDDFKKDFNTDTGLKELICKAKNPQEAIKIANNLGYDITLNDIENDDELSENMLEAVAGGKGKHTEENITTIVDPSASGYKVHLNSNGTIISSRKK